MGILSGAAPLMVDVRQTGGSPVLLHAIEKRTAALPPGDIEIAKTRFEDFRKRMNTGPRRPPRAAGHDAP